MKRCLALLVVLATALLLAAVPTAFAGTTEIVSVDSSGNIGNSHSMYPNISADGRYVAFSSYSSNLDSRCTGGGVFLHDNQTGTTECISFDSNGNPLGSSEYISMSRDGKYIAFTIFNGWFSSGFYLRDIEAGTTTYINGGGSDDTGRPASFSADDRYLAFKNGQGYGVIFIYDTITGISEPIARGAAPWISGNGRYVAFESSDDLLPEDTDQYSPTDIYIYDRQTGALSFVSNQPDYGYYSFRQPFISLDGRYVTYYTSFGNLFINDRVAGTITDLHPGRVQFPSVITEDNKYLAFTTNQAYVYDMETGNYEIASVNNDGIQGNLVSLYPSISADGQYVAFMTASSNLAVGDTNGAWDIFVHNRGSVNNPPSANAGADITAECTGVNGASVTLSGSASSDPDGDALTYTWAGPFGTVTGETATVTVPYGTSTVTLTVDDGNGGTDSDTISVTVQDTTPPSTTAMLSGTVGNNDWYTSAVTVTLTSNDNCSGVSELSYGLNGSATTVTGGSATVTVGERENTLSFHAVDGRGNTESVRTVPINVDVTPPAISITGVQDGGLYPSCQVPQAGFDATDSTSGVATSSDSLTSSGTGLVQYTYSVTAEDNAGLVANTSVTYEVISSEGGLEELVSRYVAAGLIDPVMETSLMAKLKNGAIGAFINQVQAQSGKKISPDAASILIGGASCF